MSSLQSLFSLGEYTQKVSKIYTFNLFTYAIPYFIRKFLRYLHLERVFTPALLPK